MSFPPSLPCCANHVSVRRLRGVRFSLPAHGAFAASKASADALHEKWMARRRRIAAVYAERRRIRVLTPDQPNLWTLLQAAM